MTLLELTNQQIIDNNYIIIENKIYDLTSFEKIHPGGEKVLQYYRGKNATEKFNKIHGNHENNSIKEKLETFFVGNILR